MIIDKELEARKSKAQSLDKQTGVIVPEFVYKHPPIIPEEAVKLAQDFNLLPDHGLASLDERGQYYASKIGLRFCRRFNVDISGAYILPASLYQAKNITELFDLYPKQVSLESTAQSEQTRRVSLQQDIFQLEKDLLKKRGIIVPNFNNLLEYCSWVPEHAGYYEFLRRINVISRIAKPEAILWDLQDHYNQTIIQASQAFNPLQDWEDYLNGKIDITTYENWYLQNMGNEDIDYYSKSVRWDGEQITQPQGPNYDTNLLTHTTDIESANMIVQEGYINSRKVCFSANRICGNYGKAAFIFPKQILERNYNLQSYLEPGCKHENEVRAYEPISLDFCLAIVPVHPLLFSDLCGSGFGTFGLGEKTITRWSDNYGATGKLWAKKEGDMIRKISDLRPALKNRT